MANILLNDYCNLDCDYCFANNVRDEDAKKMDMEEFQWVLDFLARSNSREIRLIGGEPTLHPEFPEIVLEASRRDFIDKIHIFTNGAYESQYNELFELVGRSGMNMTALINFNSRNEVGERNYESMKKNVSTLANKQHVGVTLSLNFYLEDQDYDYVLDVAEKYDIPEIRWAVTVPPNAEEVDPQEYFNRFTEVVVDFVEDAYQRGIHTHPDCTGLPICVLSDDQLRKVSLMGEANLRTKACDPIVDIKPDMTAIRCFAMDDYTVNVKEYDDIHQLMEHFQNNVDGEYQTKPLMDSCKECKHFQQTGQACECLAFMERGN